MSEIITTVISIKFYDCISRTYYTPVICVFNAALK